MGHCLMDVNHNVAPRTETMVRGDLNLTTGGSDRPVNGPKRISDPVPPRTIDFDSGEKGNPVTFLRNNNAAIVAPF